MKQTQKDMIDKVKEIILKQDWIQDHNIEFGDYIIYFSGMEKEVIISETQLTINHYIRTYDMGNDFLERYYTQEFPLKYFHHDLTPEEIADIIKLEINKEDN